MASTSYLSPAAAATFQVRAHPCGVLKLEVNQTNDISTRFIQIHDSATTPAAAAVPKKSWPAAECAYKEFKNGELDLEKGCFIGLSSTELTYTAQATNISGVMVELDRPDVPTGTSTVGDLTTNVQELEIWNDAAGPKKLITLEVDGDTGNCAAAFGMFFGQDSPAEGSKPIFQIPLAANTAYLRSAGNAFQFGKDGRDMTSFAANSFTPRNGCTFVISTTTGVLTTTAENYKIKAEYK